MRNNSAVPAADTEVLHGAATADIAKKTGGFASGDIEVLDAVALSIKGAFVGFAANGLGIADRGPGSVFLIAADLAEIDIGDEDSVGVAFAAIDFVAKFCECCCAADLVRILRCASALQLTLFAIH